MSLPEPLPHPATEPQPPNPGPSPLKALLLLLLPCVACVGLGLLNRTVFGNSDILVVPMLGALLIGPWIVGIIAAVRIGQRFALGAGVRVLMGIGFIIASFALCLPGCATLL